MELSELISELARQLGTPDLALNTEGVATFTSEDGIVEVYIERGEPGEPATVYSVIGKAPESKGEREALFRRLLEAQLFNKRICAGASFGLDQESGDLFIWSEFDPASIDLDSFLKTVGSVYHWSSYWIDSIAEIEQESGELSDFLPGPGEIPSHFLRV